MPDERGIELVARSVHVNDERVDPAARALLSRPQQLPRRDLLALLRRSEPLILDAEQAESFGGALALLAPFLRKGSSAALIPIATPAELLATLTIISLHPERPVAGEIAETALAIAGQAALAIDNARLYGQQKAFADTMQRSLLPRAAPELPELELGDVYESAARVEVGGDVYDYLTLGDGRLAVVLGDVTGHGVDATADMAMAKYVFRSLAREHPDPGTFLAAANEVVSSEIAPGRFITMVEVVFDVEGGEVACASAGHPPPRLVLPDGSVQSVAGARARARDRRAAGLRHGHGAVPAGRDRRRLHRRRHRGTARRRAVRRRTARRAAGRAARPAAAGDRAGGPRRVPRLDRGRAHRRLRGGRRQALAAAGRRGGMSRSQAALAALVFGAGIGSLATEIAASRMLAPYFGSSTIVWANLIGIVLAGLALGYWLGGKLADRRPERRLLGLIVLAAALWVAMTPFLARPFLDAAVGNLDDASAGAVIGSFFAVLLLFAPAVVLLGMVSPFAIRLAITDVESAGEVAGRFYALSTVGSLVGTFVPALILIPLVGTQRTLLVTAALLAVSASFLLGRKVIVLAAAIAALAAVPPGAVKAEAGLLHEEDSLYQFIQVIERDDGRRLLRLNEGVAVHSIWRRDTVLTGGVWDAFLALPPLLDRPLRRVAILGNAGGTTARALGRFYPDARVDGVELDPAVSRAGREYFGMEDNPNLTVYDADARPFLRRTDERYDLIIVDAYHQPYVPFYLATREFFRLARERLAPGGIVALNVASVPGDDSLLDGIAGTLTHEFDSVAVWPALRFNKILLAFDEPHACRPYPSGGRRA